MTQLVDRIAGVEERIQRAVSRAGRRRDEITLIAVTKTLPSSAILDGYEAGLREFGENYVQELESKHPDLANLVDARFHLIGHLQSNKAQRAAALFHAVQTVDTPKLARRLGEHASGLQVMLEVKLSPEGSKSGAFPSGLPALAEAVRSSRTLQLTGLMTMPPWFEDPERARPYFVQLRRLAEQLSLPHLSMGMSNDFEVAIEEGATHVRVGTAIFGPRDTR